MAQRVALVQAVIGAKRSETGDIYELDPLLEEEEACTRSAVGRLVDELAHQGHLLVRHKKGMKCNACRCFCSKVRCPPAWRGDLGANPSG